MSSEIPDELTAAMTVTGDDSMIVETQPGEPPLVLVAPEVTAEPKKPSLLFLVGSLTAGNYVALGLRMLGGVLQARCVTPSVLGLFYGIGLIQGYIPFLQLGILNGVNRELPYFVGKGDRRRVFELAAAAQAWALALGTVVSLTLFGVAGWQFVQGDFESAAGWNANAILAIFLFYNTHYLQMTYRTGHDFARLAAASVVENVVALGLVVLVAWLNFYGLCLRALLTGTVSLVILQYWRPVRVGPIWDFRQLKHLLIIGAPIFGVGQLCAWWGTLDSTLVLHYKGVEGMGLYAIVFMAGMALDMLPQAVLQVMYPRMAEQYGRTGRLHDLLRMARKPILFTTIGMIPTIAVAWWLAEPSIRLLVPAYVGAIAAVRWRVIDSLLTCFQPVNHVFNVVRRQDLYLVAIVLGMAAYLGSLKWLIRDGVSLAAFPQAMLIGRVVFVAASYAFVGYLKNREPLHGG